MVEVCVYFVYDVEALTTLDVWPDKDDLQYQVEPAHEGKRGGNLE